MQKLKSLLFAGVIVLPLHQHGDWQLLAYSTIPANQVSFTEQGMVVRVEQSASPVIYALDTPRWVRTVKVSGRLSNLLAVSEATQGLEGADDFSLKVGLVVAGNKTLNLFQRMFSPEWIKTLYQLAPAGTGVDRIHFLNAVQYEGLLGRRRQHPLSDIIYEHNVWLLKQPGDFEVSHTLEAAERVIAIWLSIDGDDSRSVYTTAINSLILED